MAFWIYIIQCQSSGRMYTGHTSDLERRLAEHNHPTLGKRRYTRKHPGPWRIIHTEPFDTRSAAMDRERFLKSGQGRQWIQENILNEDIRR